MRKILIGILGSVFLLMSVANAATYTYDSLNRLTQVAYANGATVSYAYDSAGNILAVRTSGMSAPGVAVSPTALKFGDVPVGQPSAAQTVTVANTGNTALTIGAVTLTGTNLAEFTIASDTCSGQTLSPSAECRIDVIAAPTSEGAKTAELTGQSNDCQTPLFSVPLDGTGVAEPPQQYTLTIVKTGSGAGVVTGGDIDCGSICAKTYPQGTPIILTVAPDSASTFSGWTGGNCSEIGDCTVTMNADLTIAARFVTSSGTDPGPGPGSTIPEPGTLILVGAGLLGLLGLGLRRWKKKNSSRSS